MIRIDKVNNTNTNATDTNTKEEVKMKKVLKVTVEFKDGSASELELKNGGAKYEDVYKSVMSYVEEQGKEYKAIEFSYDDKSTSKLMSKEKESLFDRLDDLVEEAAKEMKDVADEGYFRILRSDDEDIYQELLEAMISTSAKLIKSGNRTKAKTIADIAEDIYDTTNGVEDLKLRQKIRVYVTKAFRKITAALMGGLLFTAHTAGIAVGLASRVLYKTGKEAKGAAKAIGSAFKVDIIDRVRNA